MSSFGWRESVWSVIGLGLVLVSATAVVRTNPGSTLSMDSSGRAIVGEPAPWFSGWDRDNQVVTLEKLLADPETRGVTLTFFATWCAPCKRGLKMLKDFQKRLEEAGIRVVVVDFGEAEAKATAYVDALGLPFTLVTDRHGRMRGVYLEVERPELPRTVVVGRDGRIAAVFGEEGADYIDRIVASLDRK